MSALGQKQTYAVHQAMSALPPKADMCSAIPDVRFGPKADIAEQHGARRVIFCALLASTPVRPHYSEDLLPTAVVPNPSAARPRFRSSRAAAVRLRIRFSYQKSSTCASSSPVRMTCTRSTRLSSPLAIVCAPLITLLSTTHSFLDLPRPEPRASAIALPSHGKCFLRV